MGAHQILVLIALVCFAAAAFFSYTVASNGRGGSLVAAGLFFLTLAQLVTG